MGTKKNIIIGIIIFTISVAIGFHIFGKGLFVMHDDTQVARLFLFDKALKSGQFPVRWVDELGFGFGYPLFIFYPPFVYMLGDLFHIIGFNFIDSVKLVFYSGIFFSGLAMYIFAKEFLGKLPGLVAALFYMLVPYRALDIYIRGALAESFSFVWLPLILWSLYKLFETKKIIYAVLSSVLLALLMITHNLIFLPFMILLSLYLVYLIVQSENRKKFMFYSLLAIFNSLLLSAFFWMPALLEKKFTLVDEIFLATDYRIHFVYPQQLWNWSWGFGGSAAGLVDGISFKVGKLYILGAFAAFIIAILHLTKYKSLSKLSTVSPERSRRVNSQLSILFFTLFIFSAFMTTSYSKSIWEFIKPLAYLQFPWRFLTFTALFCSILAGALVYFLRYKIIQITFFIILIAALIPNLKLFKPQSYRTNLTDTIATSPDVIKWDISSSSFEFSPKGVVLYENELGTKLVKIEKNQINNDKVKVLQGNAQVSDLAIAPDKLSFNTSANDTSSAQIQIFNFPGWEAKIDGVKTTIEDNNPLKLISLKIPAGNHNISVKFINTPVRNIANIISLLSILYTIFYLLKLWITRIKN